jgi:LysM repeat protein
MFDKLLLGNKASSSLWSGFLTGATAYGIGQAQQAYAASNAAGTAPTPGSVPALDAETMAKDAANAKAYGIDGADSTADMNKAIMQTAEPGTTPADYSQIGANGAQGAESVIVAPGDTMSSIAKNNGMLVQDLMAANPQITNPDVLKAGQELNFPAPTGNPIYDYEPVLHEVLNPVLELKHSDSVVRSSTGVTISSQVDLSTIDISKITPDSITGVYLGYYYPYSGADSCTSSYVSVYQSGSRVTARFAKGGCLNPAQRFQYQTKYIKIPTLDLLYGAGKADLERKAIVEANAKAEIEAKAKAAELKAKQEAEAKARAETEAREAAAVAEREAAAIADAQAAAAAKKKKTITCVKGKLVKKVTAVKPKCPSGYRAK